MMPSRRHGEIFSPLHLLRTCGRGLCVAPLQYANIKWRANEQKLKDLQINDLYGWCWGRKNWQKGPANTQKGSRREMRQVWGVGSEKQIAMRISWAKLEAS